MQNVHPPRAFSPSRLFQTATAPVPRAPPQPCGVDEQFVSLLSLYRGSGGLARAEEVSEIFRHRDGPDAATLAQWIVDKEVLSLEWQSATWLPLFQFKPADMTPRPELAQVMAELNAVFDAWQLADWFAQPHACLARRTPVEALVSDPAAVLHAARAERFIACG